MRLASVSQLNRLRASIRVKRYEHT